MYSEEEVGEAVAKACEGLWTEAQVQLAVEGAQQKSEGPFGGGAFEGDEGAEGRSRFDGDVEV